MTRPATEIHDDENWFVMASTIARYPGFWASLGPLFGTGGAVEELLRRGRPRQRSDPIAFAPIIGTRCQNANTATCSHKRNRHLSESRH